MHLRPIEPEDLEFLYNIENNMQLWEVSNSDAPYSRFALKQYIASTSSIYESGELRLIIDLAKAEDASKPIGIIDLMNYSPLNARAEVGIALLKEYRKQGYASQALQQMETFAVNKLRIHCLYAWITSNNKDSLSLFHNAAYKHVANLPDWHYIGGKYIETALFQKIF